MIRLLTILFFLGILSSDNGLQKRYELTGKAEFIVADNIDNLYSIKGSTIRKYSAEGKLVSEYTNNLLGNIFRVDVTDPMRILVYFKDFNQVLYLNNQLAELNSPVLLDDLGVSLAELVCASSQGGFWVYDSQDQTVKMYNASLQLAQQSISLSGVEKGRIIPVHMTEKNDRLYISLQDKGILVFDRFGAFLQKLPDPTMVRFQMRRGEFIYTNSLLVCTYNPVVLKYDTIFRAKSIIQQCQIGSSSLFVLHSDTISAYSLKQ